MLSTVHLDMDKEDWEFSCRDLHSFEVPYNTTDSRGIVLRKIKTEHHQVRETFAGDSSKFCYI